MNKCPLDGGFIGEAGCTHPNHQHSELVEKLLSAKEPVFVDVRDADAALKEGFYVKNPEGNRVGFGKKLLDHLNNDHHLKSGADARKQRLMFAVKAVTNPDKTDKNHRGFEGRTLYAKAFVSFGMVVITERGSNIIEYAFTIIPKPLQ